MLQPYGILPDGTEVVRIPLKRGALSAEIISFGATIRTLCVPDRNGESTDVVLGFDDLAGYLAHTAHFGAAVGRFANRIGGAAFDLNGAHYTLNANNHGVNHLHGGPRGFDRQVWTVEAHSDDAVTLLLASPDGQEGYPGTMTVRVTYTLEQNSLRINYCAASDKDTLCNLTNHSYFNLDGHAGGSVGKQTIQLFADFFTPTDALLIPTGELRPVGGTPLDLREPTPLGAHWDDDYEPLRFAGGYDHNFAVRGEAGMLRSAAIARSARTGIGMCVETDCPGIQLYSGNSLGKTPVGKGGARYERRGAFCLETQRFPDAPHHESFPSAVLRAGEEFHSTTIYRFSSV